MTYVRPQYTGRVPTFCDDPLDNLEWAECPSCLSQHHVNNKSCNGKREQCDSQCEAAIGEIRCQRPANHLGEHDARSEVMHVEWRVKGDDAWNRTADPDARGVFSPSDISGLTMTKSVHLGPAPSDTTETDEGDR